jgi:hypothetical protein
VPLRQVLNGAAAICKEAGIAISGGHSIVDEEPKFGLFVTGTIDPRKIVSNAGARPGRRAGPDQADRHRRADHGGEAQTPRPRACCADSDQVR